MLTEVQEQKFAKKEEVNIYLSLSSLGSFNNNCDTHRASAREPNQTQYSIEWNSM